MSDHDRGAYTPHHDAPLSFDARKSRGRRAFPTTLLVSLLILIGLTLAIVMFYRSGVRGASQAPVPVGTPVGEIKSPPPPQAQQPQPDAGQGLQIYKSESGAQPASGSAPATFGPAPEQPVARPAAPVAAQPIAPATAQAAPAPVAAAPVKSVPVQPAPVKPVPAQTAPAAKPAPVAKSAPKDAVGDLLDKADAAKRAPPKAATAPAKPEPTAGHGAAVVQFGAFSSAALASSEWTKLAGAYPSAMSGKGRLVETVQRDGKTLFRGAVSGFAAKADAVAFCAKLKADGKACIVR
jgi:cytoskeletal protein RodZ